MKEKRRQEPELPQSETGRIRFRRVRFQTPNSVSFLGLTEFRGANSVSSAQPIICVPKRTHRVFSQNSPSLPQNSVRLGEFTPPEQYSRNSIPPVSGAQTKVPSMLRRPRKSARRMSGTSRCSARHFSYPRNQIVS